MKRSFALSPVSCVIYQRLYGNGYGPECGYVGELNRKVNHLCQKYGIKDWMPRYVPDGPYAVNKWISEKLQNIV